MPSREPDAPESTLDRIMGERKDKASALAKAGKNPYRNDLRPTHTIAEVRAHYDATKPATPADAITPVDGATVTVAGRVVAKRGFGKTVFAPIRDTTGDLQLYLNVEHLDAGDFAETLPLVDTGDIVLAEGAVFWTKRGEMSVLAKRLHILTKSLRPLPDKWHGLTDVEARYRQRYVDLAVAPEVREVFRKRTALIRGIRSFLDARRFLEVETPMMHPIIGGAAARPFITHHNTLDMKLYMRIAPELYLKRLVVGGLERVYEINRNFRNEGIDRSHNPEFTMLEFYMAYATHADLMDLTEEMIAGLAHDVNGGTKVVQDGVDLELAAPWRRLTIRDAVRTLGKVDDAARVFEDPLFAAEIAVGKGVAAGEVLRVLAEGDLESSAEVKTLVDDGRRLDAGGLANVARRMVERYPNQEEARVRAGHLGYLVFEATAEAHLVQPTFLTEFPVAVSPLARRSDADPAFCDRFELFVNGRELANAFSELNDPTDQRARFVAQLAARTAGAHETMDYDEDYCRALEVGMPPTAGEGVGIDRLTMLLTGQPSIRDVILFPLMRPE
jgi:lysyl-tRNA synthetase class 2